MDNEYEPKASTITFHESAEIPQADEQIPRRHPVLLEYERLCTITRRPGSIQGLYPYLTLPSDISL